MDSLLDKLTTSPNKGNVYWHIKIHTDGNRCWLLSKEGKIEAKNVAEGLYIVSEKKKIIKMLFI